MLKHKAIVRGYFIALKSISVNTVMDETAKFYKENAVRFERLLPVSVDRAWALLTDTKLLTGWYGNGKIEPRVGGGVSFMDGHIKGTVTHWSHRHGN